MTPRIRSIELFAGAGGMALGLEQAGFEHSLLVENDRQAVSTLKTNRPHWNVVSADVKDVDYSHYKGVDVVTGGVPCQAFSYAGKRLGFEDVRGTLFGEFARCVKGTQPKVFLFENVKGLLRHDKGRTFDTIASVFTSLGYTLYYQVLDASFYGVGQKRERLFIVGVGEDVSTVFHFPEPQERRTTLRDSLHNVPESLGVKYSEKRKAIMDLVPPGGYWRDLPQEIQEKEYPTAGKHGGSTGMARRLQWDEPSLTLTTSPSQKMTERCHPDHTRPLTVREYARVQSFPDDWVFTGGITAQYKHIGNAVPVELARRIGVSIKEQLF